MVVSSNQRNTVKSIKKDAKSANISSVLSYGQNDMRNFGEGAASLQEVEKRVGRNVKLPDASLMGGKPIFRTESTQTAVLVYPNNVWISSGPFPWPERDPNEYYAEEVRAFNANPANGGPSSRPNEQVGGGAEPANRRLIEVAGNPGFGEEKGQNIIKGKSYPRPAFIEWTQDGIEYYVSGAPGMPLTQVVKIAESVAYSDQSGRSIR